jgi:hypothetical protein
VERLLRGCDEKHMTPGVWGGEGIKDKGVRR